ncbi:hypothetical protein BLNAU_21583 [Blattamonas nauphoetae]|uniref:Uncharacterized protein n=1 Tax=Blattamonas nauphoetae TaxID=2049346 RepID=A0ABQ9WVJ4_9EUKA|nr:hypothetical protein BLNAU_21583 [Blattamonas nauphoetae]
MFRDEDQGEFTVEIEEISTIPAPYEPFIIIGQADTASQQESTLPAPANSRELTHLPSRVNLAVLLDPKRTPDCPRTAARIEEGTLHRNVRVIRSWQSSCLHGIK